jgi:hypothetical protein
MSVPPDRFYELGSGLAVPGVEATLEYGDASKARFDHVPGALLINDLAPLEKVRVTNIDGPHNSPEPRDTRSPNADRHGERGGIMLYGGRTIGLTGRVEAGNVAAMRDRWARLQATFGTAEQDLLIHPPNFFVPYRNELLNPDFALNADAWSFDSLGAGTSTAAGGVTDGVMKVGEFVTTGAGAGTLLLEAASAVPMLTQPLYLHALVKVQSASAAVSSISVIAQGDAGGSRALSPVVSPATGTWYKISGVLTADQLVIVGGQNVSFGINFAVAAGNFTVRVARCTMTYVAPNQSPPVGWVSGNVPGYEWEGVGNDSRSIGPRLARNHVNDSTCTSPSSWSAVNDSGVVLNQPTSSTPLWAGDVTSSSIMYWAVSNAGGQVMTVSPTTLDPITGHAYRLTAKLNFVDATFMPPQVDAVIVWRNNASSVISTNVESFVGSGTYDVEIETTAPPGAVQVQVLFGCYSHKSTASGQSLILLVADPCLVDVTYFDVDPFSGAGRPDEEVALFDVSGQPNGAQRRVARTLWLKRTRKVSIDSPEQQSNLRYQRPFTMSLRADDPRIYVFDDHSRQLRMSGTPQLVVRQMPVDFSLNAGTLAVPTGWTYEGNFVTHPGSGTPYNWSQDAYNWPLLGGSPTSVVNNGVTIKAWDAAGSHGTNRPASDLKARMYRSAETYTYTSPRVVMGCSPQSTGQGFVTGNPSRMAYYSDLFNVASYANTATILVKRVSSTTWLELRWSSMSVAASGGGPNPLYAFELWCSHNTSGTLATTRLSQWDYASYDSASGNLPFNPLVDQMYLVSYMLANVVHWELWRGYPSISDTTNRLEAGSYTLSSSLQPVVGTSVAGSVGMSLGISRTASQNAFNGLSNTPPFVHYFESSKADVPGQSLVCPVIGTIDTPQRVQLRGDLVDPIVSITVPEFDGKSARTSVAKFAGTLPESAPITIDMDDGSVLDAHGANQYGMMLHGSSFEAFRPGLNVVSVQAKSWSTAALAHAIATWNDALR